MMWLFSLLSHIFAGAQLLFSVQTLNQALTNCVTPTQNEEFMPSDEDLDEDIDADLVNDESNDEDLYQVDGDELIDANENLAQGDDDVQGGADELDTLYRDIGEYGKKNK